MSKTYYNHYFDIALIINEKDRTFSIKRLSKLKRQLSNLCYLANERRLRELKHDCLVRGFVRVWATSE